MIFLNVIMIEYFKVRNSIASAWIQNYVARTSHRGDWLQWIRQLAQASSTTSGSLWIQPHGPEDWIH
jgi:hypothetical protein